MTSFVIFAKCSGVDSQVFMQDDFELCRAVASYFKTNFRYDCQPFISFNIYFSGWYAAPTPTHHPITLTKKAATWCKRKRERQKRKIIIRTDGDSFAQLNKFTSNRVSPTELWCQFYAKHGYGRGISKKPANLKAHTKNRKKKMIIK